MKKILRPLGERFDRLPGSARAGLWMSLSAFGYSASAAVVKHLSDNLPTFEIVFFRNFFGLMFMLPWVWQAGLAALKTGSLGKHALRGALSALNMWCMFGAFALAPLADVSAISFLLPVIGSVFAVVFLKERSSTVQWIAVLAGFCGAIIVMRPGMGDLNVGLLLALAAVLAGSVVAMLIKQLLRTDSPDTVALYLFIFHVVYSFIPMVTVWVTPTPIELVWLLVLGWLGALVQRTFNRAMLAADATVALPFNFSRLIWAAGLGWIFFAEIPDGWTWVGGTVIFIASLALVRIGAAKPSGG